ncbi:Spy/CpxP family protein refolding chaperone [Acidicapsa acidisoli]|uniref:Spy/CpxP family protein refolding chaperone n=1 Tax=Acidicapsa acidisoli TaxID=1615681 RepID=UPI0021DF9F0E|nr:Spy/CpxP family protein refolding chaperone [Acidicapsa acidisoli]
MKSMQWKCAVAIAVLGIGSLAVYGQSGQPANDPQNTPQGNWHRGGGPERELHMLTERLSLTPEQQTGVKAVLDQQATQMKALRTNAQSESAQADTPEARQARMTQINQIHDETDTKISALLDDNQKKTYAEIVQHRKAMMARRQGGNPPETPQQ